MTATLPVWTASLARRSATRPGRLSVRGGLTFRVNVGSGVNVHVREVTLGVAEFAAREAAGYSVAKQGSTTHMV
jgi:hypothetical protein